VQAAQGATRKPLLDTVILRVRSAKPQWKTSQTTKRAYTQSKRGSRDSSKDKAMALNCVDKNGNKLSSRRMHPAPPL
jgi:hypothetical protein